MSLLSCWEVNSSGFSSTGNTPSNVGVKGGGSTKPRTTAWTRFSYVSLACANLPSAAFFVTFVRGDFFTVDFLLRRTFVGLSGCIFKQRNMDPKKGRKQAGEAACLCRAPFIHTVSWRGAIYKGSIMGNITGRAAKPTLVYSINMPHMGPIIGPIWGTRNEWKIEEPVVCT